ncbi:UNVERIFIED_ORG: putative phiE125 gp8 family phage protein [Burkholderia sp. CF145]
MASIVIAATGDGTEPVSVDLAKAHCRVDVDDDDVLFESVYIPAARQTVEGYTGLALLAADVDVIVPGGRAGTNSIPLPVQPVDSITALSTVTSDGIETPLDLAEYGVTVTVFRAGSPQMITTRKQLPSAWAYRAQYATGFGNCPPALLLAILEYIGDAYENRESQQSEHTMQENPRAIALMVPFRLTFGV